MNRTVSSNRAGGESFEGLLERLTRGAGDTQANLDSSFASGSSLEAASLPETRRRTLSPVTETNRRGSKVDSMPLSYEKALRLHTRRNLTPDTGLRNSDATVTNRDLQRAGHARAMSAAAPLQSRPAGLSPEIARSPAPQTAPVQPSRGNDEHASDRSGSLPAKRKSQKGQKIRTPRAQTMPLTMRPTSASTRTKASLPTLLADVPAKPSGRSRTDSREGVTPQNSTKSRSVRRNTPPGKSAGLSLSEKTDWGKGPADEIIRPVRTIASNAVLDRSTTAAAKTIVSKRQSSPLDKLKREELALELQPANLQLEHRHSVVSIRLNEAEIERLRQRAVESGISVSAYMRSCVLDAEHLRAQVKEALAEMRASIHPISQALPRPQALQGESARQSSHLPVFSTIESGGSPWSRLLWKSATFLLGPWFFFRHRA